MADANPAVMEMVEEELKKNPDISNAELLEKARQLDESVAELSPRQFNAMYPLQVKRAMSPRKPASKRAKKTRAKAARAASRPRSVGAVGDRDHVRTVLLKLARDVADAQGKGELVDVVAGIDRYVDRVFKA
ncbi:MAG: hypothetical protein ACOCVZ_09335 [Gemmatimonadota bacterium]